MTNPPLTFVINIMSITSIIAGHPEMMFPTIIGTLATGSVISHLFPKGIADKYTRGDVSQVKMADIGFHWFPAITLYLLYRSKKLNNRHVVMALALPLLYFSVQHTKNDIRLANPLKHLQETYPGVPLWVFSLYGAGALSFYKRT